MIATAQGAAPAIELASLPPTVADYLRRLVARMNASNERVHAHLVARGVEAAELAAELAAEREAPGMAKCRIELADFRAIAGKQGFDGPALIEAAAREYGLGQFASFRQVSFVPRYYANQLKPSAFAPIGGHNA